MDKNITKLLDTIDMNKDYNQYFSDDDYFGSILKVAEALKGAKAIAVLDKADSLNGCGGALFEDVVSGMFVSNVHVPTVNYVYGIGGRDTTVSDIRKVYDDLASIASSGYIGTPYRYLGLRGEV